jgi:hypothetical protein
MWGGYGRPSFKIPRIFFDLVSISFGFWTADYDFCGLFDKEGLLKNGLRL